MSNNQTRIILTLKEKQQKIILPITHSYEWFVKQYRSRKKAFAAIKELRYLFSIGAVTPAEIGASVEAL